MPGGHGPFTKLLNVFALLAGILQSVFVNVPTASASNLDAEAVYIFFDPAPKTC